MTAVDPKPPSTIAEPKLKIFTIDTDVNAPRELFVELRSALERPLDEPPMHEVARVVESEAQSLAKQLE